MNARERNLVIIVAVLVGLVGLWYGYSWYQDKLDTRYAELERLEDQLAQKQMTERRAAQASRRLDGWEKRSLPADLELAGSLYQTWLTKQVETAKFARANVDAGRPVPRSRTNSQGEREHVYHLLPFTVRGRGTLSDAVGFLYTFYSAPHMHQIRRISLKPTEQANQLDILLSIEAVSMPTADSVDQLSTVAYRRLQAAEQTAYQSAIVSRAPFSEYVPPPPPVARRPEPRPTPRPTPPAPTPPPPPEYDIAQHAVITGIVEMDSDTQVWINERTTGRLHQLSIGDPIRIGRFRGRIIEIGTLDVLVELDGGDFRLLTVGESLADGVELPRG